MCLHDSLSDELVWKSNPPTAYRLLLIRKIKHLEHSLTFPWPSHCCTSAPRRQAEAGHVSACTLDSVNASTVDCD